MSMHSCERNKILIALCVGGALLASCARDAPPPPRASVSIVADEIISVANDTPDEKRIVLTGGAVEHTLGVVTGHSSRSFPMPSGLADSTSVLQLEARERRETTGLRSTVFLISSGKRVVWTLDKSGHGLLVTR
jgi:hypothetical protein